MIRLMVICVALASIIASGCAAVSNPVADAIPVRRLPAEVLGRPKSDLKPIPLTVLRQPETPAYLLDKGDLLAVIAEDIIAPANQAPPIRMPDQFNRTAAIGFPVPVDDDGTISLPRLKPISVKGKTLKQVEEQIRAAASGADGNPQLIKPDAGNAVRIGVQLLERRTYSITVVREDTIPIQPQGGTGIPVFGTTKKGAGFTVRLPAGENDVLRALNAAGGPPGLDAKNELLIYRGGETPGRQAKPAVRIPLRIYPEQELNLSVDDIILKDGDVVMIEARDTDVFYVAGVAGSRQFPLPRDYDLDVLQALSIAGAPLANGGFTQNAFVPQAVNVGIGAPSPALCTVLRQMPGGQQIPIRVDLSKAFQDPRERIRIQPGDFLVMQERPGDAIARYLSQTLRLNSVAQTANNSTLQQTVTATIP
jgi:protein involved in polysaccharide export with SLBB domain